MKIKKKGQPGLVFDGATGQLIGSAMEQPAPDDIPSIVERYIGLVGKVLASIEKKGNEKGFESRDVNSVAAIGRAVAMLQAVEEARITRVGGKSVKEIPTAQLRKLLSEPEPVDGDDKETEHVE